MHHWIFTVLNMIQASSAYRQWARRHRVSVQVDMRENPAEGTVSVRAMAPAGPAAEGWGEIRQVEKKTAAWFPWLYVRMRYRRMGVAGACLKAIEEFLRGKKVHEFWISCPRSAPSDFLMRYGFQEQPAPEKGWYAQKKLFMKPLASGSAETPDEPEIVRKVREAILEAYERQGRRPDLMVHPAFRELEGACETKKGGFGTTPVMTVWRQLKDRIRPGCRFLELGSGDGRATLLAASFGAAATGVECDADLIRMARESAARLISFPQNGTAIFLEQDFFEMDFSKFDFIYYAGGCSFDDELRLKEKIRRELAPAAIFAVRGRHPAFEGLSKRETGGGLALYGPVTGGSPKETAVQEGKDFGGKF